MRTFSTFALLAASLLVKDVFASPIGARDSVVVEVSEEVTVIQGPDGKLTTGQAVAIKTVTEGGAPPPGQAIPTFPPPPPASSAPASSPPAVFQQKVSSSAAPAKPSTTAVTPPPHTPTTLATSAAKSSSAAPSSAPSSSPSTNSGAKRGLAYNDVSLLASFPTGGSISWAYNWGSGTSGSMPKGIEYVPMLWGNTGDHTSGWKAAADKALASGSTHLLGFNEPDHPAPQSNIDYQTAQKDWKTYMSPYSGKAKLGSPAVTNGVTGDDGRIWGLEWLDKFLGDADVAKTVDFVACHWYGGPKASVAESLADLKNHMADAQKSAKGKPVWLTEYQYVGPGDASDFVTQANKWLDQQSYIERYSYFMVTEGNLIQNKALSPLGSAFATA